MTRQGISSICMATFYWPAPGNWWECFGGIFLWTGYLQVEGTMGTTHCGFKDMSDLAYKHFARFLPNGASIIHCKVNKHEKSPDHKTPWIYHQHSLTNFCWVGHVILVSTATKKEEKEKVRIGDDGKIMMLDCVKTKKHTMCTSRHSNRISNHVKQNKTTMHWLFTKKVAEWNSFCPEPTYVKIRQLNHNMFMRSYDVISCDKRIYDTLSDCS